MKKHMQRPGVQVWEVSIANPSLKEHVISSQPRHVILENVKDLLPFSICLFIKYKASLFYS